MCVKDVEILSQLHTPNEQSENTYIVLLIAINSICLAAGFALMSRIVCCERPAFESLANLEIALPLYP